MSGAHLLDGALARMASYLGVTLWCAWPAWSLVTGRLAPRRASLENLGLVASAVGAALGLQAAVLNAFAPLAGEEPSLGETIGYAADIVAGTTFGQVWALHAGLLVAAAAVRWWQERPDAASRGLPSPWPLLACGAGTLATLVALGHGGEQGLVSWRFVLTLVHFACAWLWLGGLICLLTERLAPIAEAMSDGDALRRFSRFALAMMMVVLATGAARSIAVGVETDWQPALAYVLVYGAKLAFVVTLLCMAARIRRNLQLSLAFDRRIVNEMAVALAVLTLTALLSQLPTRISLE